MVRDSHHRAISEALEGLQTRGGVRLKFTLCDIPEQEDWGTADSLRHIRSKVKVHLLLRVATDVTNYPLDCWIPGMCLYPLPLG